MGKRLMNFFREIYKQLLLKLGIISELITELPIDETVEEDTEPLLSWEDVISTMINISGGTNDNQE